MKLRYNIPLFILSFICFSAKCGKDSNKYEFEAGKDRIKILLEQYSDSLYKLNLYMNDSLNCSWTLSYPVYKIDFGDVNNDGMPEILVGTVKPTRFDPKPDNRLFIFKITDDYYIRPLWLGSRVSQPLVDFKLKEKPAASRIRTIEKEENGTYLVAEYRWRGFGLDFIEYLDRGISLGSAQEKLSNN